MTRQTDGKSLYEQQEERILAQSDAFISLLTKRGILGDHQIDNEKVRKAKQEKNRNESRIRFLENMIKTAKVFDDTSGADQVGLYDKVTVYMEDDDETEVYQIVTTMRQDVLKGLISKESPVGRSLLGKRVGDRVHIQVNENYGYDAVIRSIEKGEDTGEIPLNRY